MMNSKRMWQVASVLVMVALLAGLAAVPAAADSPTSGDAMVVGIIEQMPAGGLVGEWVIGGQTVIADEQTTFDDSFGPFAVGAYAVAMGYRQMGQFRAWLIKTADPGSGGGGGHHGYNFRHLFGYVEQMPQNGFSGTWVIDDQSFETVPLTRFIEMHGRLTVGAYVHVMFYVENDVNYALMIATVPEGMGGHWGPGGGMGGHFFGYVGSIPEGRVGTWVISDESVEVTDRTHLVEWYAPLKVGSYVFVHYWVVDGVKYASVIGTVPEGTGGGGPVGGHYFGYVEVMPANGIGTWTISGLDFVADESTVLRESHGPLGEDAYVHVRFVPQEDGSLYAQVIDTIPDGTGMGGHGGMGWGYFGTVDSMPDNGPLGTWTISGEQFQVNEETILSEHFGTLEEGAYVYVRYYVQDDVKIAMLIAVVPDGSGGLMGDLNGDCNVNVLDLMMVASSWGSRAGQNGYTVHHDMDGNGMVDFMDIMDEARHWGNRCGQPPTVASATAELAQAERADVARRWGGEYRGLMVRVGQPNAVQEGLWQVPLYGAAGDLAGFEMGLRLDQNAWEVVDVQLAPWLNSPGRTWAPLVRQEGQRLTIGGFSFGHGPTSAGKDLMVMLTLRGDNQPELQPIYLRAVDSQATPLPATIR